MSQPYRDKLKDIRWSVKRADILIRDELTCKWCFVKDGDKHPQTGRQVILEVHHFAYPPPPIDPWECPDRDLITLCSVCHSTVMKSHDRDNAITGEREKERLFRRNELRVEGIAHAESLERLRREDETRREYDLNQLTLCHCGDCVSQRESQSVEQSELGFVPQSLTADEWQRRRDEQLDAFRRKNRQETEESNED